MQRCGDCRQRFDNSEDTVNNASNEKLLFHFLHAFWGSNSRVWFACHLALFGMRRIPFLRSVAKVWGGVLVLGILLQIFAIGYKRTYTFPMHWSSRVYRPKFSAKFIPVDPSHIA